jgi:hypothetical protein
VRFPFDSVALIIIMAAQLYYNVAAMRRVKQLETFRRFDAYRIEQLQQRIRGKYETDSDADQRI